MNSKNNVELIGIAVEDFTYLYSIANENFYTTTIKIERLSGVFDYAELMVSDKIFDITSNIQNHCLSVSGEVRTYNDKLATLNRLKVYILVKDIEVLNIEADDVIGTNLVQLGGYICKKGTIRTTPLNRTICDVTLAVNRESNKSSYIPLIFWNDNARHIKDYPVGSYVEIEGRFQSRNYYKNIRRKHILIENLFPVILL